MVGSLAEIARRSFAAEWSGVSCPTLLVLARSSILPPAEIDELLRRRPGLTSVSVPGTGHDLHLQRPEVLCDLISGFLHETPRPAAARNPGPASDVGRRPVRSAAGARTPPP
jgi:pimeloyl-ACP methyl ester carboxylesterase